MRLLIRYVALAPFMIVCLLPLVWMFANSLKANLEIWTPPPGMLPRKLNLQTYAELFRKTTAGGSYLQWLWNSLLVTVPVTVLSILVSSIAAYAIARFRFLGRRMFVHTILIGQMLPAALLTAPTVFVRCDGHVPPLTPLYDGPFAVLSRSAQHFKIQMGTREEVISTSRLKPCSDPDAAVAQPRRRSWPPGQLRVRFNLRALPPACTTPDQPAAQPSQPCIWPHFPAVPGGPLAPPARTTAIPGPEPFFSRNTTGFLYAPGPVSCLPNQTC